METPIRPRPEDVARWSTRARRLRWLDAGIAWIVSWALMVVMQPELSPYGQATVGGVAVAMLGTIRRIRLRWRPLSGLTGLWVSRMLAPGDHAWYVRPEASELVIVTARRGLRLTVAAPGRGAVEGMSVRRTRVLLVSADDRAPRALGGR